MAIKLASIAEGSIDVPDADHRCVHVSTNGKQLSGHFKSFKDSETADAESDSFGDTIIVNVDRRDMPAKVKGAIRLLKEFLEDAAIAEAGVEAVEAEAAIEADEDAGIEAKAEVKRVKGVRAGRLYGGSVVRSES